VNYPDGSAVNLNGDSRSGNPETPLEFDNIVNCSSRTYISSGSDRSPVTSYCHFYSNRMSSYLLLCAQGVFSGNLCYFVGNDNLEDPGGTFFGVSHSAACITVRNCCFDGALPSTDFMDFGDPCFGFATRTSFPLYHHHTAFCLGILRPTSIFTLSSDFTHFSLFSRSNNFVPSSLHSQTVIFPVSIPFLPSFPLTLSFPFSISSAIQLSVFFADSRQFPLSHLFSPSAPFSESFQVSESNNYRFRVYIFNHPILSF
jgi:hypothetical protein